MLVDDVQEKNNKGEKGYDCASESSHPDCDEGHVGVWALGEMSIAMVSGNMNGERTSL